MQKGILILSTPTANVTFTINALKWDEPTQEGENLSVTQTYSATQTNNELLMQ